MEEKIVCPYCGADMRPIALPKFGDTEESAWIGLTKCSNADCKAAGPMISAVNQEDAIEKACAAALGRAAFIPLTLYDAMRADCCYVELKSSAPDELDKHSAIGYLEYSDDNTKVVIWRMGQEKPIYAALNFYGKTWRCWSRRPTPEERAAAPWED